MLCIQNISPWSKRVGFLAAYTLNDIYPALQRWNTEEMVVVRREYLKQKTM